jgi:hypothetical protein
MSRCTRSGRQDLNLRPPGPQPGALPDCATPRDHADSTDLRPPRLDGSPLLSTRSPPASRLCKLCAREPCFDQAPCAGVAQW